MWNIWISAVSALTQFNYCTVHNQYKMSSKDLLAPVVIWILAHNYQKISLTLWVDTLLLNWSIKLGWCIEMEGVKMDCHDSWVKHVTITVSKCYVSNHCAISPLYLGIVYILLTWISARRLQSWPNNLRLVIQHSVQ